MCLSDETKQRMCSSFLSGSGEEEKCVIEAEVAASNGLYVESHWKHRS